MSAEKIPVWLGILRAVIEWASKLWQVLLPLGGVLVLIGMQIHISYGCLYLAIVLWVVSGVCWLGGVFGLVWSFLAVRAKEKDDSLLV